MDNDRLEEYVNKNQSAFQQVETPNLEGVWNNIDSKPSQAPNISKLLYVAIGLLVLIVALLTAIMFTKENENSIQQFVKQSPELLEEQENWMQFVQEKEKQLSFSEINREEYADIFNELDELEKMEESLEHDFNVQGDKEKIIRILFRKYERRSKILEQLLAEIDKNKIHENNDAAPIY